MREDFGSQTADCDIDLTQEDDQGDCLNEDDHEWGTYTYEILVLEYEDEAVWTEGEALDSNFLKRYKNGYKFWVPEHLPAPNGDEPGHDVWIEVPEEGPAELRAYYCLHSEYDVDAEEVSLITVDPDLDERASVAGPTEEGVGHGIDDEDEDGEFDGIKAYEFQDSDPAGTWRVVFTAADQGGYHSPLWRTHDAVRMLPANAEKGMLAIVYITGTYKNTKWHGAWHRLPLTKKTTEDTRNSWRTPIEHIDQVGNNAIEVGTNGGFFYGGKVMGDIGVGLFGQWLDEQAHSEKDRWAFGWTLILGTNVRIAQGASTKAPLSVKALCRYGLSGIGCLKDAGGWKSPEDQGGDWPDQNGTRARTAIAWSSGYDYFFQIVAQESDGWTWNDTVDFFKTELPNCMLEHQNVSNLTIGAAMMLDGGGSSAFIYKFAGERHTYDQGTPVPTIVRGSYDD